MDYSAAATNYMLVLTQLSLILRDELRYLDFEVRIRNATPKMCSDLSLKYKL